MSRLKYQNEVILFANSLWFLRIFKKDLINELSANYSVTCYFLKKGDLDNSNFEINNLKFKYPVKFKKLGFVNALKEFLYSLIIFTGLRNFEKKRFKILVFTIGPIFLSRILFFSNQRSIIYTLEGLGRVFTSKRMNLRLLKRFVEFFYSLIFKNAQNVVVLNSIDASYLAKKKIASLSQIYILPGTGLNLNKYNKELLHQSRDEKYIDYIGRILPEKGFYEFIYSRKMLIRHYPEIAKKFKYRVIAPFKQIQDFSKEQIDSFKKEGILLCPYKTDTNFYYKNTHILVHPTQYGEGLSMVILEASYLGIKIITTKNRGTEEILKSNYKYFLKDYSPIEIADLIYDVSLNKKYFESHIINQRIRIKEKFDNKSSILKFMEIIKRV